MILLICMLLPFILIQMECYSFVNFIILFGVRLNASIQTWFVCSLISVQVQQKADYIIITLFVFIFSLLTERWNDMKTAELTGFYNFIYLNPL